MKSMSYIMDSLAVNESEDFYYRMAGCVQPHFTLYGQVLPHHVGIQLCALTLDLHGPFGHDDILLRKAGGKMEPLLDQQNREPARFFKANDHILDLIHD